MNLYSNLIQTCIGISLVASFCISAQDDTLVPLDDALVGTVLSAERQLDNRTKANDTVPALHAEIQLNDMTKVKGMILHHTDSVVIIKTTLMGEVSIDKRNIQSVYESRTAEAPVHDTVRIETASVELQKWPIDNSGYSLLFMPTAFVQPTGSVYFRDRELFFMNIDFSPIRRTSFSAGCLFPITFDYQMLTFGAKFQLITSATPVGTVAFAATGNAAFPLFADVPYWSGGCVTSYRSPSGRLGFHGLLGIQGSQTGRVDLFYNEESSTTGDRNVLYGIGTEGQITPRSKVIVELFNYAPFQETADISYLSFGFRVFGERLCADIGALTPMKTELSGMLLIPYVSVAVQIR